MFKFRVRSELCRRLNIALKISGPVNGYLGNSFSSVINCISKEVRPWLANPYFDKSFRTVDQYTILKIYCILEYNYHILNRPLKIKGLFSLFIHTLHTFIVNKAFKSPLSRRTRMSISIFLSIKPKIRRIITVLKNFSQKIRTIQIRAFHFAATNPPFK